MGKAISSNPLNVGVRDPFDYGQLEAKTAAAAQAAVQKIRGLEKAASVDIGRELLAMKERLPHGQFLPWLEAEFSYSRRTATNLMQVAETFGDKWETVAHLPAGILYQLAAPSTPVTVRDMVVSEIPPGKVASPAVVKMAIQDAKSRERKDAAKAAAKKETPADREAKQTAAEKRRAAEDRKIAQQREQRDRAAGQAVQFLQEQLGPHLFDEFLAMVRETTGYDVGMKIGDAAKVRKDAIGTSALHSES